MTDLPYFDFIFTELQKGNSEVATSFGHHVHWGYWDDPDHVCRDAADYRRAADRLTQELFADAGLFDGQSILDVGCGFGGTLACLNEQFGSVTLTGLNIDPRQIERARSLVQPKNGNSVAFIEGDACHLPFPDQSFDRVLAVECIFHFPSREAFLREAFRVLKPGGRLTLSDFVPSAGLNAVQRMGQALPGRARGPFGRLDFNGALATYRALAGDAGFAQGAQRDITGHTRPTYGYLKKIALADWATQTGPKAALGRIGSRLFFDFAGFICTPRILGYWLLSFCKPASPNPG